MIHTINISIHVLAGTIALIIGTITIISPKGSRAHRRFGWYFLILLSVVVATGFFGWLFFRSNSFLLMLTVLSGYVGYTGYRAIKLREQRLTGTDIIHTISALTAGVAYMMWLNQSNTNWSPSVVYPTLSALVLVAVYDLLKYFWLHPRIKGWWLYEHIYKMVSAYSAILSAFCGTVLPQFKPYSQILPSVLSLWVIVFFIVKYARRPLRSTLLEQV